MLSSLSCDNLRSEEFMRSKLSFSRLIFCVFTWTFGYEKPMFMYPVAAFESAGITHVLVLYQLSKQKLELYDFDTRLLTMTKILMSWYTPAGVKMLPDFSGFSFIDNGRIRIKKFAKRAIKSLDIYDPIYDIELVNWLDDQTCYFHARSNSGHYGIYTLTLDEVLTYLLTSPTADYMYPNIIGSNLFFIECRVIEKCSIYSFCSQSLDQKESDKKNLISFGVHPFVMLHMQSLHEGYAIEYLESKGEYLFNYVQLLQTTQKWSVNRLFNFSIPKQFLNDGPCRVYESLLPFIPKHYGMSVYFSTYDNNQKHMVLYHFDKQTNKIFPFIENKENLFVPIIFDKTGWYGGSVSHLSTFICT